MNQRICDRTNYALDALEDLSRRGKFNQVTIEAATRILCAQILADAQRPKFITLTAAKPKRVNVDHIVSYHRTKIERLECTCVELSTRTGRQPWYVDETPEQIDALIEAVS